MPLIDEIENRSNGDSIFLDVTHRSKGTGGSVMGFSNAPGPGNADAAQLTGLKEGLIMCGDNNVATNEMGLYNLSNSPSRVGQHGLAREDNLWAGSSGDKCVDQVLLENASPKLVTHHQQQEEKTENTWKVHGPSVFNNLNLEKSQIGSYPQKPSQGDLLNQEDNQMVGLEDVRSWCPWIKDIGNGQTTKKKRGRPKKRTTQPERFGILVDNWG
ncbi:glycosyltransferase family 9 protein [Sesbania bispinosa]|nr:glycosyltransferase family 9 protein [Sesbania bispinosa]